MNTAQSSASVSDRKSREAFRTISEVADELDLPQHVLRFWESKFAQIKPLKRGGNRRYYRPDDVTLLKAIKTLLHSEGYTIKGVQKLFKAQGLKATIAQADGEEEAPLDTVDTPVSEEVIVSAVPQPDTSALRALLGRLKAIRQSLD